MTLKDPSDLFTGRPALEPAKLVALEACAGAHHWMLEAMGHKVKLIPPQYVKPFVKRNKNDRNDAEAISEAALADHPAIPDMAKAMFEQMGRHVTDLNVKIQAIDRQLLEQHKSANASRQFPASGTISAPPDGLNGR